MLKLFRLKSEEAIRAHDCCTLVECDSCTKHGFKMHFFLTVYSLSTCVVTIILKNAVNL